MSKISPIYHQSSLIKDNLDTLDAKHYHDLTEEIYEHLQQIRFAVEEIQSIEKFKRNVSGPEEPRKGN